MKFYQDFATARGVPVALDYRFSAGTDTTYSPISGASGGDPCEVDIVDWWPETENYNRLCRAEFYLRRFRGDILTKAALGIVRLCMKTMRWWHKPTDEDFARFTDWLIENHVDEPYDLEDDYR